MQEPAVLTDSIPLAGLIDEVAEHGFAVADDCLDSDLVSDLASRAVERHDRFRPAAIGRGAARVVDTRQRSDRIDWIGCEEGGAPARYLRVMEGLRLAFNQQLFLGLFDYECHFAHYRPGAFYATHRDAFAGQASRRLSTVLYLSPDWRTEDGGELCLYGEDGLTLMREVSPRMGRMVVFLSERFPHEVRPARRDRFSLAGWFRVR